MKTSNGGGEPGVPRKNLLFKLRPVLRWIIKLRGSTTAIAGGFGLGTFIAFTPTIGVQVVLALFVATLINVNRVTAVVPVWITNPVTMAPLYTFNYWLGCLFLEGPPVKEVSSKLIEITKKLASFDIFEIHAQVMTFMHLGKDIIAPLILGSILAGAVSGAVVYFLSFKLLEILKRRKGWRKRKQG